MYDLLGGAHKTEIPAYATTVDIGPAHEEGRRLLLGEVNAAIDGALAAGATEIICNDSHGTMNNLDPAALDGQASYVSGRHKPLYMMQGLDATADVVFMVGYHGPSPARARCCRIPTTHR